jgi:Flp pilus assembly protein TadG
MILLPRAIVDFWRSREASVAVEFAIIAALVLIPAQVALIDLTSYMSAQQRVVLATAEAADIAVQQPSLNEAGLCGLGEAVQNIMSNLNLSTVNYSMTLTITSVTANIANTAWTVDWQYIVTTSGNSPWAPANLDSTISLGSLVAGSSYTPPSTLTQGSDSFIVINSQYNYPWLIGAPAWLPGGSIYTTIADVEYGKPRLGPTIPFTGAAPTSGSPYDCHN